MMRPKFKRIFSILLSVLFFIIVVMALGSPLYYWIWYSSSAYDSVREVVKATTEIEFLFAVLCLAGLWSNKFWFKIICILVFFVLIHLFYTIPGMQKVADIDTCIDINYCKEYVNNTVSYEDCKERKGAWNIDDKACDYSFDLNTCQPRFQANWELPKVCNNKL